ncbi:MAG: modification methylase, partial [Tidjanibacter sp.]|nr:modification methylase [Tidjanibacter sp.]
RVSGVTWFTNLDIEKKHEELILYKHYTPEEYPTYDNYEAINVNKTSDIPCDYDGVMGVPITFLDKYNPDQFEIIDINPHFYTIVECGLQKPKQLSLKNVGMKDPYARILIRKRK